MLVFYIKNELPGFPNFLKRIYDGKGLLNQFKKIRFHFSVLGTLIGGLQTPISNNMENHRFAYVIAYNR